MEDKPRCPRPAQVIVPWAGKIIKCCRRHALGLVRLGGAMGSPVEARELPPNHDTCELPDDLDKDDEAHK